jgi:hypothetical protein
LAHSYDHCIHFRVLSYPEIQTIVIHMPSGDNRKADFGDLGEWVRLLSHVMVSCPNLQVLDVVLEHVIDNLDRMGEFMSHVFPRLPQESKACVNIVFVAQLRREHFQVGPSVESPRLGLRCGGLGSAS